MLVNYGSVRLCQYFPRMSHMLRRFHMVPVWWSSGRVSGRDPERAAGGDRARQVPRYRRMQACYPDPYLSTSQIGLMQSLLAPTSSLRDTVHVLGDSHLTGCGILNRRIQRYCGAHTHTYIPIPVSKGPGYLASRLREAHRERGAHVVGTLTRTPRY